MPNCQDKAGTLPAGGCQSVHTAPSNQDNIRTSLLQSGLYCEHNVPVLSCRDAALQSNKPRGRSTMSICRQLKWAISKIEKKKRTNQHHKTLADRSTGLRCYEQYATTRKGPAIQMGREKLQGQSARWKCKRSTGCIQPIPGDQDARRHQVACTSTQQLPGVQHDADGISTAQNSHNCQRNKRFQACLQPWQPCCHTGVFRV